MLVKRSPGKTSKPGSVGSARPRQLSPPGIGADQDAFWTKMGDMLGGLESRLKRETEEVKNQLSRAIGDLGTRVAWTENRMDGLVDDVNQIVDRRLAWKM